MRKSVEAKGPYECCTLGAVCVRGPELVGLALQAQMSVITCGDAKTAGAAVDIVACKRAGEDL